MEKDLLKLKNVTRRIFRYLELEKHYSVDELLGFLLEANSKEKTIINEIKIRLSKVKLYKRVQDFAQRIGSDTPEILVLAAKEEWKKIVNNTETIPSNKAIKTSADFHLLIKALEAYETLFPRMLNRLYQDVDFEAALHEMDKTILVGKIYDERRLYLQQTIKHLQFIQKHKLNLRYDHLLQLKLALNPEFSDEIEIFQEQTDLLIGTYGASSDPRITTASKDICYKFIEAIFNKHSLLSGKLIIFPFLGGWISMETHDLLIHNKAALTKYGLNELVFYQTLPLYQKVEKKIAQGKELSSSDKYVLSLYKHFRKD